MTVNERERLQLLDTLVGALGEQAATTLMALLPTGDWQTLATGHDVRRLDTRIDVAMQRLDDKIDVAVQRLDDKIDVAVQRLDAKIDGIEQRLDAKIDGVEQRLEARIQLSERTMLAAFRGEMLKQNRTLAIALVGALTANSGLVLAALRLGL